MSASLQVTELTIMDGLANRFTSLEASLEALPAQRRTKVAPSVKTIPQRV